MKYDKLVRDKIPEYIRSKDGTPVFHLADDAEYWEKLKEKVVEEFEEFKADESLEEFADLLEVLDAIMLFKKFDMDIIKEIRRKKVEERGGFRDRIILDEA